ncbi:SufE family protein [Paracrocinitomix mangrovi]|uniref:SufE family protein n=1 Tax=Paracrocinitomix mangrovi TaxID=2862509 RepID=UPI001C8D0934|nr:SufE family protein [Paracrocinitomix mangrovi]UKN00750.1 SufE family protein [Paracrocinitomix mangrovi]
MSILEKEQELIEDFSIYEDWMEKYEYIIELGKDLPLIDNELKTDDRLIKGCQSKVWMNSTLKDGKVIFTADADAVIAKGIISLLVHVLSNEKPEDIVDAKLDFIKEIGLQEHLSPTRSNGLVSMVKQMKMDALALKMVK